LEKFHLFQIVLVELLLVAVLGEIDEFKPRQAKFRQPCKAVFVSKRTLFLSPAAEDPKLVIFCSILLFFFLGSAPSVVVDQPDDVLPVTNALADLDGLAGHHSI